MGGVIILGEGGVVVILGLIVVLWTGIVVLRARVIMLGAGIVELLAVIPTILWFLGPRAIGASPGAAFLNNVPCSVAIFARFVEIVRPRTEILGLWGLVVGWGVVLVRSWARVV